MTSFETRRHHCWTKVQWRNKFTSHLSEKGKEISCKYKFTLSINQIIIVCFQRFRSSDQTLFVSVHGQSVHHRVCIQKLYGLSVILCNTLCKSQMDILKSETTNFAFLQLNASCTRQLIKFKKNYYLLNWFFQCHLFIFGFKF